jgi:hypothetical protein
MQGRITRLSSITVRLLKKPLTWAGVGVLACAAGAVAAAGPAQAEAYPPSTSSCQYSNSATAPNSSYVVGVTPGSTITISCAAGSFPDSSLLAVIEASGLSAVVSPASAELDEVDLGTLQLVTTGADGSLSDTFTVPTTFSASDPNAACPATQAQINVGLACNLVIANLSATPLDEAQIAYAGQGRPNNPTLRITVKVRRGVKTLTASDWPRACPTPVTATSHCWWGAPVTGAPNAAAFTGIPGLEALVSRHLASNTLQVSPAVYCQTGATAAACAGLPEGTLVPPALSGTITVRRGLQPVIIDEPNTTPYRGRGLLLPLVRGTRNVEAIW